MSMAASRGAFGETEQHQLLPEKQDGQPNIDKILQEVGHCGKFHWIQVFLLWTASLISGMAIVAFVFTGAQFE